jgi:hypothetical protein
MTIAEQLKLGVRWFGMLGFFFAYSYDPNNFQEFDLHFIRELEDSVKGPYRICYGSNDLYEDCSENGTFPLLVYIRLLTRMFKNGSTATCVEL